MGVYRDAKVQWDNATLRTLLHGYRRHTIRDRADNRVNPGAAPATGEKGIEMKKRLKYIAIVALLAVLLPTVAYAASSIVGALYYATIVISNN